MTNAVRRAVRTYFQSAIGIFLGLWATAGIDPGSFEGLSDLTVLGKLGLGALIGAVPALLSYVQNALEDSTGKGLLRPELGTDEVGGDVGLIGWVTAIVGAVIVLAVIGLFSLLS